MSYTIYNFKYLFKSGSKTNILYGILSTGEKCTILFLGGMDFKTTFTNLRLNNYLPNALGKIGLTYLMIGDFLQENELVYDMYFSFTNLQEFLFPRNRKCFQEVNKENLLSVNTDYGKLEVKSFPKFSFCSKSLLSALIYSDNKDAKNSLIDSYIDIEKQFPDADFKIKDDIFYQIILKSEKGIRLDSIHEPINKISDLLS